MFYAMIFIVFFRLFKWSF